MIYIVVPTFNREEICRNFIQMIKRQTCQDYILVLVDHGSNKVGIKTEKHIKIIESNVNGWAKAINVGLRYVLKVSEAKEDAVLIINDDVILKDDYLECCIKSLHNKPNAILGTCCLDSASKKIMRASIKVDKYKAKNIYCYQGCLLEQIRNEYLESDLLTGKGTLIPIGILKEIGIYAEEKLPHYKADHELIWRAKRKGYSVYVSKEMYLETASGQIQSSAQKSIMENLKFMFIDMRSTMNLKDLKNYSELAYDGIYRIYYFLLNLFRNTIFGSLAVLKTSITHKTVMHK